MYHFALSTTSYGYFICVDIWNNSINYYTHISNGRAYSACAA